MVASTSLLSIGCRPGDQRTETLDPGAGVVARDDMPADVLAQLDSGTAAFRADDFEAALDHYARVTELAPDLAQGWFGVAMAQEALGNQDAAEAAIQRTREAAPGATLLHPDQQEDQEEEEQ